MKNCGRYIVIVLIVLLFAGCATPRPTTGDWNQAARENSWDSFMKKFPHPDDVERAQNMKMLAAATQSVKDEIEKLKSGDEKKINQAAENLGNMGDKAAPAVPDLINLLTDRHLNEWRQRDQKPGTGVMVSGGHRTAVYNALIKIGKPSVKPVFAAIIRIPPKENTWGERSKLLDVLCNIVDPEAVEPLILIMKNKNEIPVNRARAAETLGKIGDARAV